MTPNHSTVLDLFESHDVVLLGESHGIAETFVFIRELIPSLHASGVYTIAIEFGAEEFQESVDALVLADVYDPHVARAALFGYNVGWPYKQYQDIYRDVWEFNQSLTAADPKMRVLNASYVFDWTGWQGERSAAFMEQVFVRGQYNAFRAHRISEVVAAGGKVLGLFGAFHARRFNDDFEGPEWLSDAPTLGQRLSDLWPNRVASVCLDQAMKSQWDAEVSTASTPTRTPCDVDYDFLSGKSLDDIVHNWPDPDWTATPHSIAQYWQIIESRSLV